MTHFGQYIRDERTRARLSLRKLAAGLGLSHTYMGAVERGVDRPRKLLSEEHWPRLMELVPSITEARLREYAELARLRIDDAAVRRLPLQGQRMAQAFARRVNSGELSTEQIEAMLRVLDESDRPKGKSSK